jgi:signal transduction histidine kinase
MKAAYERRIFFSLTSFALFCISLYTIFSAITRDLDSMLLTLFQFGIFFSVQIIAQRYSFSFSKILLLANLYLLSWQFILRYSYPEIVVVFLLVSAFSAFFFSTKIAMLHGVIVSISTISCLLFLQGFSNHLVIFILVTNVLVFIFVAYSKLINELLIRLETQNLNLQDETANLKENAKILNRLLNMEKAKHALEIQLEAEKIALKQERESNAQREELISTLSHEFRTPLTIIGSSQELLQRHFDKMTPEQRQQRLNNIRVQVERLNKIMDDVSWLARDTLSNIPLKPEKTLLKDFFQKIIDELIEQVDAKHTIEFSIENDNLVLHWDERLIHMAFTNLLLNAIKYSPADEPIKVNILEDENGILIHITDKGIGIPLSDQPNIFKPFYRGSNINAVGGIGLGLTIAKQWIQRHNGTLDFISEDGEGTTFSIFFPHPIEAFSQETSDTATTQAITA